MPRAIVWLVALTAFACARESVRTETTVPMGRLGHPIGTFLRIEGRRLESGKVGKRTLLVERVNERELSPAVGIWVDNIDLPVGARCSISGYESGRWIGVPPEVARAEGLLPRQAEWQFQRFFVATSVRAPDSLVEEFRESAGSR